MKFETLKSSYRKIIIGVAIFIFVSLAIFLTTSLAKYKTTESIPLVSGSISYSPSDIIIETYLDGNLVDIFPSKDTSKFLSVSCTNEIEATFDIESWQLEIINLTQRGSKCTLNFETKSGLTIENILDSKDVNIRTSFDSIMTDDTTGTIYSAEDDDGTSYYFAGAPTDNWVKFAGFYWRIIRINGDGTLRLIYNGTSASSTGSEAAIGNSLFNSDTDDNMYIGYMYTSGDVHGLETDSVVKKTIDNWYNTNLVSYGSYIDPNAGFCGDRTPSTSSTSINGLGGSGTTITYYAPYIRLSKILSPTYKCTNSSDLYTINTSSKGNKALAYPVGMITIDEIWYAGNLWQVSNANNYLVTGSPYITISPLYYAYGPYPYIAVMSFNGTITSTDGVATGVRPVINLRADVTLTGSGKSDDPYVVEGAE